MTDQKTEYEADFETDRDIVEERTGRDSRPTPERAPGSDGEPNRLIARLWLAVAVLCAIEAGMLAANGYGWGIVNDPTLPASLVGSVVLISAMVPLALAVALLSRRYLAPSGIASVMVLVALAVSAVYIPGWNTTTIHMLAFVAAILCAAETYTRAFA
ncbi:hypothetical protein PSRA_0599 [Pseudoscardovia radai]|uniref:Uncharacterized protein n=1 Tax=Pseudoscardovia radai TaxID=987066 RepID=A0A261EZW4_9BIFI|nr:hypothetical protein [Pseudoscardovia radai]OZG52410.1 hypothetical protein PSRA_0599 [Pseudoscardovia radai]